LYLVNSIYPSNIKELFYHVITIFAIISASARNYTTSPACQNPATSNCGSPDPVLGMSQCSLWLRFPLVIILVSSGVLIPIHPPSRESTLLDTHAIAKSAIKTARQKATILFNLDIANFISKGEHVMKRIFQFYKEQ
jgi:hypothetical protein